MEEIRFAEGLGLSRTLTLYGTCQEGYGFQASYIRKVFGLLKT
jgi:hypothetical protein